ncbi:hypothetical protein [Microbaculum sp. FT89]|uniref:hypothetical protein n=1 Tax=Microbaculum sp. FT89 TaxID=3447298 RepID=UPI003F52A4FB
MLRWHEEKKPEDVVNPIADFRLTLATQLKPGLKDPWWSVLFELEDTSLDDLIRAVDAREDLKGSLFVPSLYGKEDREATPRLQYPTVYAKEVLIREANDRNNELGVNRIVLGTIAPPGVIDFGAETLAAGLPEIEVPDGTVVTAVIDNGIAFAHELFRTAQLDKSRVAACWIMDAPPDPALALAVPQGRALTGGEIDGMLATNMMAGLLDEDRFYRDAGLIDYAVPGFKPAALRVSHGTHVMGIAAGYVPGQIDETRPIVCVQLPTEVTMDVTGADLSPLLGLAIQFIKKQVRRFRFSGDPGRRVPLVVNFSYGNFAGPHDGTGVVERMIDRKLRPNAPYERQVTLPAGNGNLARAHAEIRFRNEGDVAELDWRIQPDDLSASYVEIWLPYRENPADMVEVRVTPAGGPQSDPVVTSPGSAHDLLSGQNSIVGRLWYAFQPHPTRRGLVTISALPTYSHDDPATVAPAGVWKIEIKNRSLTETEPVRVWIRRDETLPGFPHFGRQSYFDNDCYVRFDAIGAPLPTDPPGSDCVVRRSGTLSGFACGERPSVLAGFVEATGELADYSAAGPITAAFNEVNPNRTGPDAAAVSDDTPVLRGVLSAGSRSGSLVALNGTSVAAPQAARWIAGRLAAGQSGDRVAVNAWGAAEDGNFVPPPKPALPRVGGGRTLRAVRFGPDRKA